MTEKRFKLHIEWSNLTKTEGIAELSDNGQPLLETECIEDARLLQTILNELNDEVKSQSLVIKGYQERTEKLFNENEQLKQFKEDVFNKIDVHLHMLPIARDNEFNEEYGDPSLYSGAIYMLETLKKELQE